MNIDIKRLSDDLKALTVDQITRLLKQLSEDLQIDLEKLLSSSGTSSSEQEKLVDQDIVKKKFLLKLIGFDKAVQMGIIRAIKALRSDFSLLDAKNQLNSLPFLLKGDLLENEAEILKKEWEAIGGQIEIVVDK